MIFDRMQEIIAAKLSMNEDEITMDTNLMKDLDADSLDAIEIIMEIEEQFGIKVDEEEAESFQTVSDLVNYVETHMEGLE